MAVEELDTHSRGSRPPSRYDAYAHLDDRGLQELQAYSLFRLLKVFDKVVALQRETMNAVSDIADDVEAIGRIVDSIQVPAMLRKR